MLKATDFLLGLVFLCFFVFCNSAHSDPDLKPTVSPAPIDSREERDRRLQAALAKRKQELSKGEFPKGKFGAARINPLLFAYKNELSEKIKATWTWNQKGEVFISSIRVYIEQDGKISKTQLEKSSGNAPFDQSVLDVFQKIGSFPPPPESAYEEFREVIFQFDSRGF